MTVSTASTSGEYPPSLNETELEAIVRTIKDWTIAHGLAVRSPPTVVPSAVDSEGITAVPVPVTLFPSPFPRLCFDQGIAVQEAYNELYARVSRDEAFLESTVKQVMDGDDFIRNLWDVHLKVKDEGYIQRLSLGLFRSDYMVHQDTSTSPPTFQAKQVEFNTIASSFGGLSSWTSKLHKFLATNEYPLIENAIPWDALQLPENQTLEHLPGALVNAYHAYGDSTRGHPKCVVFLVQSGERNVFDQRHLEYRVAYSENPPIPVFRLPFSEILIHTSMDENDKKGGRQLLYRLPSNPSRVFEVAVVYFRAGYGPSDYPDEKAWEARYHIERSTAIKCPTVLTQLAGTKKVQQLLATPLPAAAAAAAASSAAPSILSKFVQEDTDSAKELRKTFTKIFPMDTSDAGLQARQIALDPELCKSYVLKPQREGGGNNIYRGAMPSFLKSIPENHWGSYILMELITPPPVSNLILRNGHVESGGVICELGIYGACLWDQESGVIHQNQTAGYLLRTKGDQSEEGGVAAGYGCMDSCHLV